MQIIIVKHPIFNNRPVPWRHPVVDETDTTRRNTRQPIAHLRKPDIPIYVALGEEAVTLPTGEIKVYVTQVYVQDQLLIFFLLR